MGETEWCIRQDQLAQGYHKTKPNGDAAHVLSVVGSGYRLVHNRELFRHVEDAMCKEMSASDLSGVRVTDKVSSLGRMCYREYVFPSIKCYVGSQDKTSVVFRLIVQNGYGGSALRVHAVRSTSGAPMA